MRMLVHPWDRARDDQEWQDWLAAGHDFGQLVAVDPDRRPIVQPTHFALDGDRVLLHLARPNPIWAALEHDPRCVLSVVDDYAYVPGPWRAEGATSPSAGVPTSHYAAVQLSGTAELIDDPERKAALLREQMAHFQPDGGTDPVRPEEGPFHRMLPGIRGVVLHVESVTAKFKYDAHKSAELRESVASRLAERGGRDAAAAEQVRNRG
ncbi:FMN-binding negative transcriptional regulator [Saccharopolyspora griseoalba]|uniref:FMN-binding negative transcriptional regulator n=1 Tax=Saccharopolyspora griseoalba TaxID=1431848 RepID=A0ABW2LH30_9PSEU